MTDLSRDDLIDKVQHGELTPAEAEAKAARLHLNPLAYQPEPDEFDPMREPFWTLAMAVAWIAFRTPDAVRDWWDAYRSACWDWHFREWRIGPDGPVHEGHFLEQRSNATLARLRMMDTIDKGRDPNYSMTVAKAIDALWVSLRSACLNATGIDQDTGRRVSIPAEEWRDLTWFEENHRDVVRAEPKPGRNRARFEDVTVARSAVMALWSGSQPRIKPTLPDLVMPEGGGYMPLYCAAQWIATQGGSISFDPSDLTIWKQAYEKLLARLASEEVKVIGTRNGEREPVPGFHFVGCRIDYPFAEPSFDLLLSEDLHLCSHAYLGEEHWFNGFDDALRDRWYRRWSRLMVLKADVAKHWPSEAYGDDTKPLRTGAPGRPSSMHLVEAEFRARCTRNEVKPSITDEVKVLAAWLSTNHPSSPSLTAKTIANRLRDAYRQHRDARK